MTEDFTRPAGDPSQLGQDPAAPARPPVGPPPPVTPPPPTGAPAPVSTEPFESGTAAGGGTRETAKEEAGKVAGTAKDQAAQVAGDAKEQAAQVAGSAKEQAAHVAGTAKEEAQRAVGEAKRQAQSLLRQGQTELSSQAGTQQERLASGLRSFSTELGQLAEGAEEPGVATNVARWAAQVADDAGRWLEERDPTSVVDEVRRYARRNPGTFMLVAAGLGLAVGRVARSLKDAGDEPTSGSTAGSAPAGYARTTPGYGTSTTWSGTTVGGTPTGEPLPPTGSPVGYGTADPTGPATDTRPPGRTYGTDEPGGLR